MAKKINQSVLIWASGKVGQRVGNGNSWDLANIALKNAGAGTSADFGPTGEDDDFIWGDEVPDLKDALPGDILQYRDHSQTTTTTTHKSFMGGQGLLDVTDVSIDHEHHTSIVKTNPGNGALTVLEQNHGGKKEVVKSSAMRFRDLAPRVTVTKKMMKRGNDEKPELVTFTVTVEVTVTGTVTAFRPTA
jgi:hypothetical protein